MASNRMIKNASRVYMTALGCNVPGMGTSLLLHTDKHKYLFNCCQGLLRICNEHNILRVRSNLKAVFCTQTNWTNTSGVFFFDAKGIFNMPEMTEDCTFKLYGINISEYINNIKYLKNEFEKVNCINIENNNNNNNNIYEDGELCVKPILISSELDEGVYSNQEVDFGDIDLEIPSSKKTKFDDTSKTTTKIQVPKLVAYVGTLSDSMGNINVESAIKLKVLQKDYGKLKKGMEVLNSDGRFVYPEECCTPILLGNRFLVLECPSPDYVDSVISNMELYSLQNTAEERVHVVLHIIPGSVLEDWRYQEWIDKFGKSTLHVIVGKYSPEYNIMFGYKLRTLFHLVSPTLFPIVPRNENKDKDYKVKKFRSPVHVARHLSKIWLQKFSKDKFDCPSFEETNLPSQKENLLENYKFISEKVENLKINFVSQSFGQNIINIPTFAKSEQTIDIINYANYNIKPLAITTTTTTTTTTTNNNNNSNNNNKVQHSDPYIVFLGTAAAISSTYRASSSILIIDTDYSTIMLDCGPETYTQMLERFGEAMAREILNNLKLIIISHHHHDHQLGLIRILSEKTAIASHRPVYIVGPITVQNKLASISKMDGIDLNYTFITLDTMQLHCTGSGVDRQLLSYANLSELNTAKVQHCFESYGCSIKHTSGWKITYSGDCRPSEPLITIGRDSDLLIHEATFDDSKFQDACNKNHSTTSEAIEIGAKMNAKFTLLTHFSQRYNKIPKFHVGFMRNDIGFACDFLSVHLSNLTCLRNVQEAMTILAPELLIELSTNTDGYEPLKSWIEGRKEINPQTQTEIEKLETKTEIEKLETKTEIEKLETKTEIENWKQ